jgi:hypothetical protein
MHAPAVIVAAPWVTGRLTAADSSPLRPRTQLRDALEKAPLANTHEHTAREDERIPTPIDLFTLYQGYSSRDLHGAGLRAKVYDTNLPVVELAAAHRSVVLGHPALTERPDA